MNHRLSCNTPYRTTLLLGLSSTNSTWEVRSNNDNSESFTKSVYLLECLKPVNSFGMVMSTFCHIKLRSRPWEMHCTGTEMSVGGVTSVSNPALPKLQVWECLKIRSNHGRPKKCFPTQFHHSSANLVPNFWDITDLQTAAWPQRHQPPYQQCPKNPNQLPRAQWYQSPQIQQVSSFPAFRHQLLQITRFPTTPPRLASICASGALPVQLLGVDSNKPKTRCQFLATSSFPKPTKRRLLWISDSGLENRTSPFSVL